MGARLEKKYKEIERECREEYIRTIRKLEENYPITKSKG